MTDHPANEVRLLVGDVPLKERHRALGGPEATWRCGGSQEADVATRLQHLALDEPTNR
jgi:hypothetical protein